MRIPLSWLREYVDIPIPAELLAEKLTAAGLEVSAIEYLGLPQTSVEGVRYPKSDHLVWDNGKLLLGAIVEVKPHPNADRLVLAMVDYGGPELEQCVTGAPNLYEFKDLGPLEQPLWTVFAKEGAEVWDGHSVEPKRMILKEKPLRGIPNRSMVCSEKELGLSDSHEGIILMREQPRAADGTPFAPGTPAADVLGDIVLTVELTPNLARALSVYGVAREVAAILDLPLRPISYAVVEEGAPIDGAVSITIHEPALNPRFTFTLLRNTTVQPSPEWLQRRLLLLGQRPINNIVDVTNYVMFEMGQPLHSFDYDKLLKRASGQAPHIFTRLAAPGETLLTLDAQTRALDAQTILVCDEAGALSLGGIMGGGDSEIDAHTTNVLLEAAAWNFINIRRTMTTQKLQSEAASRFSKGVHPAQAILGNLRAIELMRQTGGGQIASGVIDDYPLPPAAPVIDLPASEIKRILGMEMSAGYAASLLKRGGFAVEVQGDSVRATPPDWRLDIGEGVIGRADLIEELARIAGYETIPTTLMDDALPRQFDKSDFLREEMTRDVLADLGLREIVSYRFTSAAREALLTPPGADSALPDAGYVEIANPIAPEKSVLRKSILTGLLEAARANARYRGQQELFEIGSIYLNQSGQLLPDEPRRLGILLVGQRESESWTTPTAAPFDFFDLKGVVERLLEGLHIRGASVRQAQRPGFHPGRCAELVADDALLGVFGELHPQVAAAFDLGETRVLAADLDLEALLVRSSDLYAVHGLPTMPPVLQDIALVVDDAKTNAEVEAVIRKAGGGLLKDVRLFDVYRGGSVPAGKKSLAYSLTYQTDDRTLTDKEVAKVQEKIVRVTERELGAALRG
ncbi:MAG TPA: phenylalanine--tRNA ligase subunit beta [Candidatus Limnocylindrales bacterium]|nr:phenylalanine--tRNA ligase subunit beta [Candidatus Limnocylindrales bacterium]